MELVSGTRLCMKLQTEPVLLKKIFFTGG